MRIGKLGIAIGKSQHPRKPWFQLIHVKYLCTSGREFVFHTCGVFINISWLGWQYKLSTDK